MSETLDQKLASKKKPVTQPQQEGDEAATQEPKKAPAKKEAPAAKPGKKTECPISRADFEEAAKPLRIEINGVPVNAEVKQFASGSFGWFVNDKVTVEVNGVPVKVQSNLNLVVVGSKDAK